MPNPSNSDLVGEAKRLSEAATPGPWRSLPIQVWTRGPDGVCLFDNAFSYATEDDAKFIARARTLLPELAQQLEQAEQREKRYREALLDCKVIAQTASVDAPVWALPNQIAARVDAALTTLDSATGQEEG